MKTNRKQTINVYKQLGIKYLEGVENINIPELPEFIKLLPPKSLVLDVGCAGGRDSRKFIEANKNVIGIDVVDEFLKEAKKRVPQAKFIKMDVMELDFPNNFFEAIWAQAVLLHFDKRDVKKILKKFFKILKENGKLHIGVKRGNGNKIIKEKLVENNQRLFTLFYKNELGYLIKEAGFKIIASRIYTDDLGKHTKWISIWGEKPSI